LVNPEPEALKSFRSVLLRLSNATLNGVVGEVLETVALPECTDELGDLSAHPVEEWTLLVVALNSLADAPQLRFVELLDDEVFVG